MIRVPTFEMPDHQFEATDNPDVDVRQYGDFFEKLDLASANGMLGDIPDNEDDALLPRQFAGRYEAMISRLKWLGYISGRISRQRITPRFKAVVRVFQKDAGIVVDGWIGPQTWHTLDALVSFESPLPVADFFKDDGPNPALSRAIHLRLWSLGLVASKPGEDGGVFDPSILEPFRQTLQVFGDERTYSLLELVALLFDQDRLVAMLAQSQGSSIQGHDQLRRFRTVLPAGMDRDHASTLVLAFVRAMAYIELYLLGFDVDIGKRGNYPINDPDANGRRASRKLFLAFHHFWRNLESKPSTANILAQSILPAFFETLDRINRESEAVAETDEDYSGTLAQAYLDQPGFRDDFWTRLKNLGKRIWDGLKRMWRWIKTKAGQVMEFAANMVRAFHRFALKAFKIVKLAGQAVVEGARFLTRRILPNSAEHGVFVGYDTDFDFKVVLSPNATPSAVAKVVKNLNWRSGALEIGSKILGFVLRTLRNALLGWPKILYGLVKSYSQIKVIYRALKAWNKNKPDESAVLAT